jgi:hypothetical protein
VPGNQEPRVFVSRGNVLGQLLAMKRLLDRVAASRLRRGLGGPPPEKAPNAPCTFGLKTGPAVFWSGKKRPKVVENFHNLVTDACIRP